MTESDATTSQPTTRPEPRIYYPFLFAVFPILSLYSANLVIIPATMMIRPLAIALGVTAILWAVAYAIFRKSGRSAVLVATILGFAYSFTWQTTLYHNQDLPVETYMFVWCGLLAILAALMTWKWKWHGLLNLLSSILVVVAVAQIAFGLFQISRVKVKSADHLSAVGKVEGPKPDIIYIILDGYGRSDALKRALNFNNDDFIDGLEKRGFYVAKDGHSNYCQTELSVCSSLNMGFIQDMIPPELVKTDDRDPLRSLTDESAVAKYLREKGYIYAAITTGFPPLSFDSADVNLKTKSGYSLIEAALIEMTPLKSLEATSNSLFAQKRENLLSAFDQLDSLAVKDPLPRFVMVHILAPHPPFVFDAQGNVPKKLSNYGFWDGSDYMEHVGTAQQYRDGYVGQATYIGQRLLKSLDTLLADSKQKPVIIVQGDHGSKLRLDQATLDRTDVNECFPNLNAFFVPDAVREKLYPGITPVNSFRLLFNGLFEDSLPTKPDKSWYSSFPQPYQFVDVTDRIATHEKMATVPVPVFPPKKS